MYCIIFTKTAKLKLILLALFMFSCVQCLCFLKSLARWNILPHFSHICNELCFMITSITINLYSRFCVFLVCVFLNHIQTKIFCHLDLIHFSPSQHKSFMEWIVFSWFTSKFLNLFTSNAIFLSPNEHILYDFWYSQQTETFCHFIRNCFIIPMNIISMISEIHLCIT